MNPDVWLSFFLATSLILVIPGPTIILVVSQAASIGRSSVLPLVTGVLLGDLTAMSLSFLGLGVILSTSAFLFSLLKWIGAVYLFFLGIRLWIKKTEPAPTAPKLTGTESFPVTLLKQSYVVTALNPKSIAFFVAFLPHFIDPHAVAAPQMIILGSTFLLMAALNAAIYAFCAGHLGDHMRKSKMQRLFNRLGGSALIGASIFTAGMQRSS